MVLNREEPFIYLFFIVKINCVELVVQEKIYTMGRGGITAISLQRITVFQPICKFNLFHNLVIFRPVFCDVFAIHKLIVFLNYKFPIIEILPIKVLLIIHNKFFLSVINEVFF